jgi:hypothetical protein
MSWNRLRTYFILWKFMICAFAICARKATMAHLSSINPFLRWLPVAACGIH